MLPLRYLQNGNLTVLNIYRESFALMSKRIKALQSAACEVLTDGKSIDYPFGRNLTVVGIFTSYSCIHIFVIYIKQWKNDFDSF